MNSGIRYPRRLYGHRCWFVLLAVLGGAVGSQPIRLAGQLLTWPQQVSLGPFLICSNLEKDIGPLLPDDLRTLPQEIAQTLRLPLSCPTTYVLLFDSKSTYSAYLAKHFGSVPNRRALFIRRNGVPMVFAYAHRELAEDLRHECTHALLHSLVPLLPLWLDEGLAEYFEVPASRRKTHNVHLGFVRWSARLSTLPPLEELERLEKLEQLSAADYRNAWAWVHFCLHGPDEVQVEFAHYLRSLREGYTTPTLSVRLNQVTGNSRAAAIRHFRAQ